MHQADPWDETARLEKQVEAELLSKLTRSGLRVWKAGARTAPSEISKPQRPEVEVSQLECWPT